MRDIRRGIVRVVLASFALAAAMGIFTLLNPGDFSDTEARVLLTTVVIGVESILALCYLSVAESRWRVVGAAGGLVSLAATVAALVMVWSESGESTGKTFGVAIVLAVALAQSSLLLALADRPAVRLILWLTLATTVLVAIMGCVAILADGDVSGAFWRAFGVLAILNVLGSIVLIALGLAGRRSPTAVAEDDSIAPATLGMLRSAAAARGVSVDALVRRALDNLHADDQPRE